MLEGRVTVDGEVASELGAKYDPATCKIAVDGQKIEPEKFVYYLVYKPKGFVSTSSDPSGRPLVLDLVPKARERLFIVGRLDRFSEGLMLLTNDGALTQRLLHPKYGVEKTYRVTVAGEAGQELVRKLTDGIWLAEGKVRARRAKVIDKRGNTSVLEIVLAEGKNREIRRMLARLDHKVLSLLRVSIGPLYIKGLSEGQWRELTPAEVDRLQNYQPGEEERSDDRERPRRGRPTGDRPVRSPRSQGPDRGGFRSRPDGDRPNRRESPDDRRRRPMPGGDDTEVEEITFTDRMDSGPGPRRSRQDDDRPRFEDQRPRFQSDRPSRRPPRRDDSFESREDRPPRGPRSPEGESDQGGGDRPDRYERGPDDRRDRGRSGPGDRPYRGGGDRPAARGPRTGGPAGGPRRAGNRKDEPRRTILGVQPKEEGPKRPRRPGGSMKPRRRTRGQ